MARAFSSPARISAVWLGPGINSQPLSRPGDELTTFTPPFGPLPGRPFTREQILEQEWGPGGSMARARTVDSFILALRQKIEADPANPRYIKTVRQVGYKLERGSGSVRDAHPSLTS